MFWSKKRIKKKAEKVAASIEEDVLQACIKFGQTRLSKEEMAVYIAVLNRLMNVGGITLGAAVEQAMNEAKAGRDEVLEDSEERAPEEFE